MCTSADLAEYERLVKESRQHIPKLANTVPLKTLLAAHKTCVALDAAVDVLSHVLCFISDKKIK